MGNVATRIACVPQDVRSRTIGRCGLRRATSSKPAASNIDLAPNHMDSALDLPARSTG
jgi:hypothetical protein